jgi:hypothetical protein
MPARTDPYKLATARQLIARCESDLRRRLSDGEKRDLLADNTEWSLPLIAAVVAEIIS